MILPHYECPIKIALDAENEKKERPAIAIAIDNKHSAKKRRYTR